MFSYDVITSSTANKCPMVRVEGRKRLRYEVEGRKEYKNNWRKTEKLEWWIKKNK